MELFLHRRWRTAISTTGELYAGGAAARFVFTLEPPIRDEKPRAIPAGRYQVVMRWSPKRQSSVPGLMKVPGFEDIEVHVGNSARDTEGCILVGLDHGDDFIGHSRAAFKEVLEQIEAGIARDGECWLTILGAETEFTT